MTEDSTDKELILLTLLSKHSFLQLPWSLIKTFEGDVLTAVMLVHFISVYDYYKRSNTLSEDGTFFSHIQDLSDLGDINDYFQRKAINKLESLGLLRTFLKNSPPSRYIKLDLEAIYKLLLTNIKSEAIKPEKTAKQEASKLFYEMINDCYTRMSFQDYQEAKISLSTIGDNIPIKIKEFMYTWSRMTTYKNISWVWNPFNYSRAKNYINKETKPINYILVSQYLSITDKIGIQDFVNWYHSQPEMSPDCRWDFEYLITNKLV
jgi:hypothetical protein